MDIKFLKTWMRRLSFRGFSIQQRLPLLICVLLLSIMITFSLISYLGVKRAALNSGRQRLAALSEQLSNMFAQSAISFASPLRAAANHEAVQDYLQFPNASLEEKVKAVLTGIRQDSSSVRAELLNMNHDPLVFVLRDSTWDKFDFSLLRSNALLNDSVPVGKFYQVGDSIYYPVIVPVMSRQQKKGHLVVWRRIVTSQKTIDQFTQLLGTHARMYVGNQDRSLWTDLRHPLPDPVKADTLPGRTPQGYTGTDGEKKLAASRKIPNTSWIVLLEFPKKQMVETASRFLKWILIIGTALLLVGIFIAWGISRNITTPLRELTAAVSAIASGNYRSSVAVDRRDELGKLARAFNSMTVQVNRAKLELEQKVVETGYMNEQLRDLSAHLQNIREEERIHIAREMHDELGQLLTGFKMDVSWLHKKLGDTEDPMVREKLEEMMGIVNEAARFVRKLASELRPSILDDLGLIPALDWHSQEFQRRSHIDVEFRSSVSELKTTELIATGLFRMYQESLTNVARHAEAKKVVAVLEVMHNQIVFSITDDGKGFDMNGSGDRKTLGLLGMRERATMIGGKLEISSSPGNGTTIIIIVPLHQVTSKKINQPA